MFGDVTFAQAPFASLGGKSFAAALSETASGIDLVSQETRAGSLVQEAASVVDSVSSANNILRSTQAEGASALSTPAFVASILNAARSESASASDAIGNLNSIFNVSQEEAASALDENSAGINVLAIIAEAVSALDDIAGGRLYVMAIAETASGVDARSAGVVFSGTIAELASAASTASTVKIKNVYPTGLQLYVQVGDVLIWTVIDDNQTPSWQNIPT